jgi:hypothetical protein
MKTQKCEMALTLDPEYRWLAGAVRRIIQRLDKIETTYLVAAGVRRVTLRLEELVQDDFLLDPNAEPFVPDAAIALHVHDMVDYSDVLLSQGAASSLHVCGEAEIATGSGPVAALSSQSGSSEPTGAEVKVVMLSEDKANSLTNQCVDAVGDFRCYDAVDLPVVGSLPLLGSLRSQERSDSTFKVSGQAQETGDFSGTSVAGPRSLAIADIPLGQLHEWAGADYDCDDEDDDDEGLACFVDFDDDESGGNDREEDERGQAVALLQRCEDDPGTIHYCAGSEVPMVGRSSLPSAVAEAPSQIAVAHPSASWNDVEAHEEEEDYGDNLLSPAWFLELGEWAEVRAASRVHVRIGDYMMDVLAGDEDVGRDDR